MRQVINKGYTITVVSWENDADNYNTNSKTVATKQEAKVYYDMMQLCKSKNNQPTGVIKLGNSIEFNCKQEELIIDFMRNNNLCQPDDNDDDLIEWFMDLARDLVGSSEFYKCRVMESCYVTYSDTDIYLEEINFN